MFSVQRKFEKYTVVRLKWMVIKYSKVGLYIFASSYPSLEPLFKAERLKFDLNLNERQHLTLKLENPPLNPSIRIKMLNVNLAESLAQINQFFPGSIKWCQDETLGSPNQGQIIFLWPDCIYCLEYCIYIFLLPGIWLTRLSIISKKNSQE